MATKTGPIIIMLKNNALIVEVGKTALTFSSKLIANPAQLRLNVKPLLMVTQTHPCLSLASVNSNADIGL